MVNGITGKLTLVDLRNVFWNGQRVDGVEGVFIHADENTELVKLEIRNGDPALAEDMVRNEVTVQPAGVTLPEVVVHSHVAVPEAPAPLVNVTAEVTPPAVHVAVTNDVQPAAVNLNLPPRKIETAVFRDAAGQIASATQIETDIPEPNPEP